MAATSKHTVRAAVDSEVSAPLMLPSSSKCARSRGGPAPRKSFTDTLPTRQQRRSSDALLRELQCLDNLEKWFL